MEVGLLATDVLNELGMNSDCSSSCAALHVEKFLSYNKG